MNNTVRVPLSINMIASGIVAWLSKLPMDTYRWDNTGVIFTFDDPEDATAFKLRFGL